MQYIKNGIIKNQSQIVIIKDDKQIINPKVEDILADGWAEYTPPPVDEEAVLRVETERRVEEMVYKANVASMINTFSLTNNEKLSVKDYYPMWEKDKDVKVGECYQYDGYLWECRQDHKTQDNWKPSIDTASLWKKVEKEHKGTIDDPIPYSPPMELFIALYYTQDGKKYICNRSSEIPLSYNLSELVGLYVTEV